MADQLFSFKGISYTVSQVTGLIKGMLEESFPDITVEGEVSNFKPSQAGHYYFSLKDREAILQAVMFKNRALHLSFVPQDGMKVTARGSVSVYAKRGNYQLIVEELVKAGEGDILALIEERKKRLAAEGLFDAERKQPLPLLPTRVAVVTSPTGAALRDILNVLRRRHSGINVLILPSPVQGEEAAPVLVRQLETANAFKLADVLIIGRGGGSLEDLLPFSEEQVVRAVAASRIPVISAVGHEVDTALTDFAADLRAPTPSAAAELVAASREELSRRVAETREAIEWIVREKLRSIRGKIERFSIDNVEREFRVFLQPLFLRLDDAKEAILDGIRQTLQKMRHRFALAHNNLEARSPQEILRRGFSVVSDAASGKILTAASQTAVGKLLHIRFANGSAHTEVKETHDHGQL
ncbi:MAG TPA: exodeoxyribonuclease VII large subunit [Spirochaetia bacterium]|nr:exodeoxyribonuclease VII large subunit [Spirochaetia bacterium]